jgi:hypothetical protein
MAFPGQSPSCSSPHISPSNNISQIVIAYITPHLLASVGWATYLIYAIFCILTYIWCLFCVPETRNVALGKEMDEVFGTFDDEPEEDLETTSLLRNEHRRRASFAAYT